MNKRPAIAIAGLSVTMLALGACGSSSTPKAKTGGTAPKSSASASSGDKVGVILPDAVSSPRWEANDRPLLKAAFTAAGITPDIQNANADKSKFASLCDSMINENVKVLLITNLDSNSGSACLKKAQTAGIKTIDYDRLTLGGGASYYVSFDNVAVGKLMGDGLSKCLTAEGKTSGVKLVLIDGDPTDNNAALFKQGYKEALQPMIAAGKYKIVGEQTGLWNETKAATAFEQLFTQANGKVDGVVSANDTMAGGIIGRLKANGLAGKVPVTGQDASKEGLQRILAGTQCMTVYKAIKKEADAASQLAIALIKGQDASSIATGKVMDTVLKKDVPSALELPQAIFKDNIKIPIADGFQTKADVCIPAVMAACTAAGIS